MVLRGETVLLACSETASAGVYGRALADDGVRVVGCGTASDVAGAGGAIVGDLSSVEGVEGAARDAWNTVGPVRGVVIEPPLVAFRTGSAPALLTDDVADRRQPDDASDWEEALAASLKVPFFFARALAAPMPRAGGGRIVFVLPYRGWARRQPGLARVVRHGLRTATYTLAKALPGAVRVFAVETPTGHGCEVAAEVEEEVTTATASAVRFLLGEQALPSGTVVNLDGDRAEPEY
jgi:NAD(P)-dependent dehydrogenase (short-subunit alcohol dehydrogenase family)